MKNVMLRRDFLSLGTLALGGVATTPYTETIIINHMQEKPLPLSPDLVRDFVIAGHGNLVKVKEMLDQQPGLLNATWDWGNGDFETAIGGAGHVGNRELAEYLISKGARVDIFVATMLGLIEVVRPTLQAFPNLKVSKGPHGLALLHHAQKGGENAKAVLDFLMEFGAS